MRVKEMNDIGMKQIYFIHAADGDRNLHNGLNKSQFMMKRLFNEHCRNTGKDFDLRFPDARLGLDQIKVR